MWKKYRALVLLIAIALFFIIEKNQVHIYVLKANHCFKNNNIVCAQKNYEKAFDLGFYDKQARERYANTIINAPFSIEAQEKTLKFLSSEINDSVTLKLEYFLHDLKLEIFRKYAGNYIKQAPFNHKIVRWGKVPITYAIRKNDGVDGFFEEEIDKAFIEWEKATEHMLLFEKSDVDPNIIIELKAANPANKEQDKFVSAYTTPNVVNNKLLNMEINFYTTDPLGRKISKQQMYNTALHEIAHALGLLGHSDDKDNVMYMINDYAYSNKEKKSVLTEADINTIKLLYKLKPDVTNSNEIRGKYLPEIVLGEDDDIVNAKLEEAKNYIKNIPTAVAGYIDLAESYVATKEYPRAIRALEHALQIADTDDVFEMLYFNLALTYFYVDNNELAKEFLDKSIKYENTENKRFLLGEIYNRLGQKDLAEKEFTLLFEKDSSNIEYLIALTNLYITDKKYFKARAKLKEFFERNPDEKENPRFKPYGILMLGL